MEKERTSGLNSNILKIIAIIAMTIDHIAYSFVPMGEVYIFMRFVGKITMPIMCYFIAIGYTKTSNIKRYISRLAIFAFISQPVYMWFIGFGNYFKFNVLVTLLLGLLAILAIDKAKSVWIKAPLVALAIILSIFCDWAIVGVVLCIIFYMFKDDTNLRNILAITVIIARYLLEIMPMQNISLCINNLSLLGGIVAIFLISHYNGSIGKYRLKYFFYTYYPAHLLLLCCISLFI